MSSRSDKIKRLRRNVETSAERAYRSEQKNTGESDPKVKERILKDFQKAAEKIDRSGQLNEVWNE